MRGQNEDDPIGELTDSFRQHTAELARFAWRCLAIRGARPQTADVEDALSNAYLSAAVRLRGQDPPIIRNMEAWLRKVVYFSCLKLANHKRGLQLESFIDNLEIEDSIVGTIQHPDAGILVSQLLSRLSIEERSIIELSDEGFTSDDIAARLRATGESLRHTGESVRQVKSRAVKKLRGWIESRDYERKTG